MSGPRHKGGFRCASFDIDYAAAESRPSAMDFLKAPGLAPGCNG